MLNTAKNEEKPTEADAEKPEGTKEEEDLKQVSEKSDEDKEKDEDEDDSGSDEEEI